MSVPLRVRGLKAIHDQLETDVALDGWCSVSFLTKQATVSPAVMARRAGTDPALAKGSRSCRLQNRGSHREVRDAPVMHDGGAPV